MVKIRYSLHPQFCICLAESLPFVEDHFSSGLGDVNAAIILMAVNHVHALLAPGDSPAGLQSAMDASASSHTASCDSSVQHRVLQRCETTPLAY